MESKLKFRLKLRHRRRRERHKPISPKALLLSSILLAIIVGAVFGMIKIVQKIADYSNQTVIMSEEPETEQPPMPQCNPYQGVFYLEDRYLKYTGDEPSHLGIDVSAYQNQINWEKVANSGIEFAMIRIGYRGYTTGVIEQDTFFQQNLNGAKNAGLQVGAYFFSQAITEDEAEEEAKFALKCLNGQTLTYPVIFDWESIENTARTDQMDQVTLSRCAQTFCRVLEEGGYEAGIYFNQEFGYQQYDLVSLEDYFFWLAEYNVPPTFAYNFTLWQYSDEGVVPGIETKVDLDMSFGDWE